MGNDHRILVQEILKALLLQRHFFSSYGRYLVLSKPDQVNLGIRNAIALIL